jgi:hypothetical protein
VIGYDEHGEAMAKARRRQPVDMTIDLGREPWTHIVDRKQEMAMM